MRAARTAASICAPAGVWVLLAHDLLGLGLGRAAMFIGLTPMTSSASISSEIRIAPSSATIPVPTFAAIM